ncbi:DUF2007 domain-containing protein [Parashewanella spongiae]|nr:DUF2007 domain-containing protein [Parashewanella spongiae]MCL1077004.1 DUF2007 domain-containing protein [Parashewanella spongiae]
MNDLSSEKTLLIKGSLIEVHAFKGLLETQGIDVELRGEALLGATGEFGLDAAYAEIWITSSQLEQAKAIMDQNNKKGEPWFCRECGEQNEFNFEICWKCSSENIESDL